MNVSQIVCLLCNISYKSLYKIDSNNTERCLTFSLYVGCESSAREGNGSTSLTWPGGATAGNGGNAW